MMLFKSKKDVFAALGIAFVVVGTYNSLVIHSDGFMDSQSVRFIKRLDELNGVTTDNRKLANQGEWIKLSGPKLSVPTVEKPQVIHTVSVTQSVAAAPEKPTVAAAITEDLELELAEVFNAKKYPQNPKAGDFSGSLSAKEGVIESLSVSLPNSESISVSFAGMAGNVFEYDIDGQVLSGMLYQMDKSSYMVTLTNGPYEGTRLKFISAAQEEAAPVDQDVANNEAANNEFGNSEQLQAEVASTDFQPVQNDNGTQSEVGTFGNEAAPIEVPVGPADTSAQDVANNQPQTFEEQAQSYGFSF